MAFPAGVQTFIARYSAVGPTGDGAQASSYVTAEIETPLVWSATGTIILPLTISKWTTGGVADFVLPLPGQGGFTAGYGGAPITAFGFRFHAQPTRSKPITPGSTTFIAVPGGTAAGSVVNIGNLVNVGAWPYSVVITQPPSVDPTTGVWTETPPGSGIYRWSAS